MIDRRLRIAILIFLWVATVEDILLVVLGLWRPSLWFSLLHGAAPIGLEDALVRRCAGQWLGFVVVQVITLWCWRRKPVWLAVAAGVRFSDVFTDLFYLLAVPSMTVRGRIILSPLGLLNLIGVVILLKGYRQMQDGMQMRRDG
jgi:hypothetical protein